jgi:hypothetical protein
MAKRKKVKRQIMAQKYIDNTEKRYNLTTQHPLNTGGELKMLH